MSSYSTCGEIFTLIGYVTTLVAEGISAFGIRVGFLATILSITECKFQQSRHMGRGGETFAFLYRKRRPVNLMFITLCSGGVSQVRRALLFHADRHLL